MSQRLFVAYNHTQGNSSGGWGCAILVLENEKQISSFEDLTDLADLIKWLSPDLEYSRVIITSFLFLPELAENKKSSWMISYMHGRPNVSFGAGMMVVNITGKIDLNELTDLIKRQGIENPTITNMQQLN